MERSYRNTGFAMLGLLLCMALGFQKTYFGALPKHIGDISGMVHFHVVVAILWIGLLVAQPMLLRGGYNQAHRRLGKISYILFPAFLLSALPMLFFVWLRGDRAIMLSSITNWVMLLLFYGLAIWHRKKSALHARYMIATGLVLLDPTLGRAAVLTLGFPPTWGNHLPYLVIDGILIALIYGDWKAKRPFKPFVLALLCFLVYETAAYTVAFQHQQFADHLQKQSFSMDYAQIENVEITAWMDLFAAQPEVFKREQGADTARVEGVFVATCHKIPFPHFNVALDLGVYQPFSESQLDAILAFFKQQDIPKFYLQTTPLTKPEAAVEWFTQRGMRHVSSWHRIARTNAPLAEPLPQSKHYTVEEISAANAEAWADFIDKVYGMPTKTWLLELVGRPGWAHVICRDETGRITAARSMKINPDNTAYFCIDAPVPGIMTQNFEADYQLSRRLIEIGLGKGVHLFAADIEKPAALRDTPAYHFWAALGFEVAYEKQNFMF